MQNAILEQAGDLGGREWGTGLIDRVTPEQNLQYNLELQSGREEEREPGRGRGIRPYQHVEMRNSTEHPRHSRNVRGGSGGRTEGVRDMLAWFSCRPWELLERF